MDHNRKTLLQVPVDGYQIADFMSKIEESFSNPRVATIFAINPEKIMRALRDPELLSALKEADFLIPDGIGTTVGIWLIHGERIARTTGVDLMGRLLDLAEKKEYNVFLFGSAPEVIDRASTKIVRAHPALHLVGVQHGYLQKNKHEALIKKINELNTDLLFVGLGSPKQEKWIQRYKKVLQVKMCMAIGGSLDVLAGRNPRAPISYQYLGLEWLYRLISQPQRFKRQLVLPKFIFEILREKLLS